MNKFFVDADGNYLGEFSGSYPGDGVEVSAPPAHGFQKFINGAWTEAPVDVPVSIERYQARIALHNAGHLSAVEVIMADLETDIVAREAWSGASSFRRDSITVKSLGLALGLSEAGIDELFIAASKIEG